MNFLILSNFLKPPNPNLIQNRMYLFIREDWKRAIIRDPIDHSLCELRRSVGLKVLKDLLHLFIYDFWRFYFFFSDPYRSNTSHFVLKCGAQWFESGGKWLRSLFIGTPKLSNFGYANWKIQLPCFHICAPTWWSYFPVPQEQLGGFILGLVLVDVFHTRFSNVLKCFLDEF